MKSDRPKAISNSSPASELRSAPSRRRRNTAAPAVGTGRGVTVWFTGLSGSGKTAIAQAVLTSLSAQGLRAEMLDADAVRKHFNTDLGFSKFDRDENVRRLGYLAELLTRNGVVVLVCAISPYRALRDEVRRGIGDFIEVYVNTTLRVCQRRDPVGLYRKALAGKIWNVSGLDMPYEPPLAPEITCYTESQSVDACAKTVVAAVLDRLP